MARVIVFAKAPTSGRVKTRLCPPLTAEAAALLHARLVRHTLAVACAAGIAVELHGAPSTDDAFFAACAREFGIELRAQRDGDIGARMAHALRDASRGAPLLLIGSDCPARSADDLRAALHALEAGEDAVLGPVEDGGYALIGLSRFDARLFEGIAWSTDQVTTQTLARFAERNFRWTTLPTRWDVDRPADLARLRTSYPDLLADLAFDAAA